MLLLFVFPRTGLCFLFVYTIFCISVHFMMYIRSYLNIKWIVLVWKYILRVIQKDGLKEPVPDVGGMAWRVNGASTHARVSYGIPSSLFTLRVDLNGLRWKFSWIRLTFSSDTRGRPELLPLHRQPICSNWWFQKQMLFLIGGCMLKRRRNARCTAVADSVLMNSPTQKILCCIVAILLSTDAAARLCARREL